MSRPHVVSCSFPVHSHPYHGNMLEPQLELIGSRSRPTLAYATLDYHMLVEYWRPVIVAP